MAEHEHDDHRLVDPVTMVLAAVVDVAPDTEAELARLDHDADLWTALGLDSMDHLAVMERLARQTGRVIEERDYPRLTSVNALSRYLAERDVTAPPESDSR